MHAGPLISSVFLASVACAGGALGWHLHASRFQIAIPFRRSDMPFWKSLQGYLAHKKLATPFFFKSRFRAGPLISSVFLPSVACVSGALGWHLYSTKARP